MEPQTITRTWRDVYRDKVIKYLEDNHFYDKNFQPPETITLPITCKNCMCELGGMDGQFGTVLLISTPTGGYPVGMVLYGIKPNGVQATIKAYKNSYVGIATRHHDYIHTFIYRITDLFEDQKFESTDGFEFGKVELKLHYFGTDKLDVKESLSDPVLTKNPNLVEMKKAMLNKIYIRNCKFPYYVEFVIRVDPEKNTDIVDAIEKADSTLPEDAAFNCHVYEYKDISKFHSDLIDTLNSYRRQNRYVFCKTDTYTTEDGIFSEVFIYCNKNGSEEDLTCPLVMFRYQHDSKTTDLEELQVVGYFKHYTKSFYTTLFGFKNREELLAYFKNSEHSDSVVCSYFKYYLTTKKF